MLNIVKQTLKIPLAKGAAIAARGVASAAIESAKLIEVYALGSKEDRAKDFLSLVRTVSEAIDPAQRSPLETTRTIRRLGAVLGIGVMGGRFPDVAVLTEGITFLQALADRVPEGHTQAMLAQHLSRLYDVQFKMTGDLLDLERSIFHARRSVQHIAESDDQFHRNLYHLACQLNMRYLATRDLSEAADLVSVARKLFTTSSKSVSDWPLYGCALGDALSRLGREEKRKACHHEAIAILRDVFALCRATDHKYASHAAGRLGEALMVLFEDGGREDIGAIQEAVAVHRLALALSMVQPRPPQLASCYSGLARALRSRYQFCTQDPADFDEAISLTEQAIALVPESSPQSVRFTIQLIAFILLKGGTVDDAQFQSTMTLCKRMTTSHVIAPLRRIALAAIWAENLYRTGFDPEQCIEAYGTVIDLQSVAAGMDRTLGLRHKTLIKVQFTTLDAAAAAFNAARLDKALEWLEQGRSLVWNQLNHLRLPLEGLARVDPALAQRIADIAPILETSAFRNDAIAGLDVESDFDPATMLDNACVEHQGIEQQEMAREWESIVAQARTIPGFKRFMLPKRAKEVMQKHGFNGPVCDALIVSANKASIHIPFPQLSLQLVVKFQDQLKKALVDWNSREREAGMVTISDEEEAGEATGTGTVNENWGGAEKLRAIRPSWKAKVKDRAIALTLAGLWVMVVKPIIEVLKLSPSDDPQSLPRIWWCPTGPLTSLPLHAAGVYNSDALGSKVSDYAISSYIPSVTSLTERAVTSSSTEPSTLDLGVLVQPGAPGLTPLPGTMEELQKIKHRVHEAGSGTINAIAGPEATVDACLEAMEHHSSIHLACHAIQTPNAPLRSGFFLKDGKLELSAIIQRKLRRKEFAFLSACQTSMGDERLPDEIVHLAAGTLAAGYRSVVGTMWSIKDQYAVDAADEFYRVLLSKRRSVSGGLDSAYALHMAIQSLRQKVGATEAGLVTWVPYIHVGF